jgi:hypothetical protein
LRCAAYYDQQDVKKANHISLDYKEFTKILQTGEESASGVVTTLWRARSFCGPKE